MNPNGVMQPGRLGPGLVLDRNGLVLDHRRSPFFHFAGGYSNSDTSWIDPSFGSGNAMDAVAARIIYGSMEGSPELREAWRRNWESAATLLLRIQQDGNDDHEDFPAYNDAVRTLVQIMFLTQDCVANFEQVADQYIRFVIPAPLEANRAHFFVVQLCKLDETTLIPTHKWIDWLKISMGDPSDVRNVHRIPAGGIVSISVGELIGFVKQPFGRLFTPTEMGTVFPNATHEIKAYRDYNGFPCVLQMDPSQCSCMYCSVNI